MREGYWCLVRPVQDAIIRQVPQGEYVNFMKEVQREAIRIIQEAQKANGRPSGLWHNFLYTARRLRFIFSDSDPLQRQGYKAMNEVGRVSWHIVINGVAMKRLGLVK